MTHDTHDTSDTREIADTSDAREIADNTSDAREIADTNDARHARETRGRRDSRRGRVKGHVESEHMQDTTPETRDMSRASTCKTKRNRGTRPDRYGVATVSRIDKTIVLFCRILCLL